MPEKDSDKEPARIGLHIALIPRARERIDRLRDETGVPQTEGVARIIEFFAELPDSLRFAILNRDLPARKRLLREAIVQMAAQDAGLDDLASFLRRIDARLGQLIQAQSGPSATDVELDDPIPPSKRRPKPPEPARRQPR